MSESKHSAGPWNDNSFGPDHPPALFSGGQKIADFDFPSNEDEARANARIAATALDMLAALQAVVRIRDKAAFAQARAAIARATGSDATRFPTAQGE